MKALFRWVLLVLIAALAVQLYFVGRIALMVLMDPQSTAFQRSEIYRVVADKGSLKWRQQWVPYAALSDNLKRAVIVSEDATFIEHEGVDLEALEKAWEKNTQAEQRAQ
ncbi:MAG: transglycosylase domain-containing protein, partial [Polaromonas sp.]|nr:transglycosylase domain-containing protein [Polaromonas sp.]